MISTSALFMGEIGIPRANAGGSGVRIARKGKSP